jgi:hypothetical protein
MQRQSTEGSRQIAQYHIAAKYRSDCREETTEVMARKPPEELEEEEEQMYQSLGPFYI